MGKIRDIFKNRRGKALFLSAFFLAFGLALFIPKQMKALNMGTKGDLFIILRKHQKYNGTYGIYTDYKPLSDGSVGYCLDSRKEAPPNGAPLYETSDAIPHKALVAMKLGYPHRSWYDTGNPEMDRDLNMYVTQCAIWGFQDGFGPDDVAKFYKAPDITYKYRYVNIDYIKQNIINLMNEVNAYTEPLDPAIWVDKLSLNAFTANSGQWLTTEQINTGGRGVTGDVEIQVEGAPAGTIVKDGWSYVETNRIAVGRPFYFDIPLQAQSGSFRVRLKSVGRVSRIKNYTTNDSKYQRIGTYKEEPVDVDLYTPYITVNYGQSFGTMQVFKTDADTGVRLPGATMRVTGPGGFNQTVTTDGNGQYWFGNLQAGTYTATEVSAPDGYTLNSTPQSVYIGAGGSGSITISNKKKPLAMLQIEKTDPTGKHLQGARFQVIKEPEGTVVATETTGSNGSIYVEKLPAGRYTIKELQAPPGYVKDPNPKSVSFFVEPGDNKNFKTVKVTNQEEVLYGDLEVIKKGVNGKFLQGAEFTVTRKSDGHVMGKMTTGSDGKATMRNLGKGTYKVVETKAPTGYLLDNNKEKEVTFFADINDRVTKHSLTYVNNQVKATAKLVKIDADTRKTLANAEFRITGPDGYNITRKSGADGMVMLEHVPYGEYTVEEIKAPKGYVISGPWKFKVEENGATLRIKLENHKIKGNLDLTKIDSETKKPIAGVNFRIDGPDGYSVEKTTDSSGKIHLENLLFGEYHITELSPAEGYLANSKTHTINVDTNGKTYTLTVENEIQRGNIEITKIDKETKKPISGVQFNITGPEGFNKTQTTNDKGVITLENVRYGEYTVRETQPATGYIANDTVHKINVTSHGKKYNLTVENDIKRGNIKLIKKDQDLGIAIPGVTFNITGPESYSVTKETNDEGIITLENVRYGVYHVRETKPATGYQPNSKTWDINVDTHGKTFELEITNKTVEGEIVIEKKDKEGRPLEGAEFQIKSLDFEVDGKIPVFHERIKTNAQGKIIVPHLRFGNYEIRELKAPSGYVLDSTPQRVNIDGSKTQYKVEFTNKKIEGNLEILKADRETGEALEGAEFSITGLTDTSYTKTVRTGKTGKVRVEKIPYGEYKVVETKAPESHVLDTTEHRFNVDKDGKEIKVTHLNRINKGYVEIIKTDSETHEKLSNARFEIYDKAGTKVTTLVTNNEGYAKSGLLNYGDYTMKEVQPPTGYNPNPKVYKIQIREEGKTYTYNIENNVIKGKIKIVKVDALDNSIPVPDVEFSVWKEGQDPTKDKALHVIRTDKNGEAITPDLRYGKYFIRETATRDDYYSNEGKWEVFIDTNGKTYPVQVENKPVTAKIKITKTSDQTGKALANAKFQIIDNKTKKPVSFSMPGKDGVIVPTTTFVSNDKGIIEIPAELRYGSYTLVEVEAPKGFLPAEPIPFEVNKQSPFVDKDGEKWLEFNVVDKIIRGSVELLKTSKDAPEVKMNGVVFELVRVTNPEKHELGKVGEYTTDNDAKIVVNNLPYGEYYFKEVKALEGYHLDENPIHFMIQEDGKVIKLGMDNRWIRGDMELTKTDIDTKGVIEGVTFELYKWKGRTRALVEEYKTDAKGQIHIKDLPYGKYEIVEKKTLENYVLDETPQEFFVQEDKGLVKLSMTNEKIKGDLQITKKDVADGKPLPNAGFKIYAEDKKTVIAEGRTDENGVAYFEKLIYGKYYYYQEFDAPEGYVIDESLFPFEVKEDGEVIKAKMTNEKIKGTLELTKVDISDGELIPNAHFAVFKNEGTKEEPKRGEVVAKGVTDDKGLCTLENIEYGKYLYQEIEAPEGYILNDALMPFEVTENGSIIKSQVPNRKITGELKVIKVDKKDDKPLEGAYFQVYKKDDKEGKQPLFKGKTNKDGVLEFKGIVYGDYYVKEVRPPEGYSLEESNKEKFSIETQGDKTEVKFKNAKIELPQTGATKTYALLGLGATVIGGIALVSRRKK